MGTYGLDVEGEGIDEVHLSVSSVGIVGRTDVGRGTRMLVFEACLRESGHLRQTQSLRGRDRRFRCIPAGVIERRWYAS